MSAKNSIMSASAEKAKEPKLKKQHSLIMNNHDTSQRKESSAAAAAASGAAKDKEAGDDKAGQTNEDKFKQFEGEGVVFKTKLIGSELVMEPRGDKMCQNSIQRLKAIIKGQKAHKKRIVMKISYDGVKIYDEKTNELLYHHEVPQISFISSDDTDSRTFGYVCDVPNKAHQFVCFKTSGPAIQVMSVISGLFEAVLEQKRKREEEESGGGGGDNNNSSTTSNNNNNDSKQSDSMLDDQLIIQDKSMTPPPLGGARREGPAATSADQRNPSKQSQQQESATAELTRQLGHTLSFSSPLDLFDGGDSGIIESPSFNDWPIPAPPPAAAAPNLQAPNAHQHQQQPPVSIPERPGLLPLNSASSSPLTSGGVQVGSAPGQAALAAGVANRVLPAGGGGHQNRSLIYNHSSVSLNDAALSNRTSFISPASSGPAASERTDRYAVFNDIDNLPSIFESTSSLGSRTNLSSVGQANGAAAGSNIPFGASAASMATSPFDNFAGGPPVNQQAAKLLHTGAAHSFDHAPSGLLNPGGPFGGRGADPFLSADQQQQRQQQQQPFQQQYHQQQPQQYQQQQQQQYQQQQQQPYLNQQRHAPTPSMMVPISAAAPSSFAFGPNAGGAGGGAGMIVGSAPMGGHQMSAHARFSSSMVAGLHQRLGSSAASIQSVGSAGGLSRQTNPFDDDFFS